MSDGTGATTSVVDAETGEPLENVMALEITMDAFNLEAAILIKDPELYQRLNSAAANLERLTVRLGPILRDVHVLTDKLSRDPGGQLLKRMLDPTPVGAASKLPRGY